MTSPITLLQSRLGEQTKAALSLGRFTGFSLRSHVLRLPQLIDTQCRLARLHEYVIRNHSGGGMLLVGAAGIGKTTIIESYAAMFPRDESTEITQVPILLVDMPSAPSVKSITEALLHNLGYRRYRSLDAERKSLILRDLLKQCGVQLIVIDNFQHLENTTSVREARRCIDWLKSLADLRGLGLVLVGLPEVEAGLNIRADIQRRFAHRIYLYPLSAEIEGEWDVFRGLLRSLQKLLPLPTETPLHEANLARRFWFATYGVIDYVAKLLESAVMVAQELGLECITQEVMAEAFRRSIWPHAPAKLNPFVTQAALRQLDAKGEPFHLSRDHCARSAHASKASAPFTLA